METFDTLAAAVGEVISERPYVRLLTEPKLTVLELIPGHKKVTWTALAQVDETLAFVELNITQQQVTA